MKKLVLLTTLSYVLYGGELIQPIDSTISYNKQKAQLGKSLFFDTILSKDNTISCASCHEPEHGWADDEKFSNGVYKRGGKINSPTILNAVFNFKQLWNGRVDTLKEQAKGPLHNTYEMDMTPISIETKLNNNKGYKKLFKKIYHTNNIKYDNVLDAIAEYEKTLITPNSKFDKYLKKETNLSHDEQKGYILFKTLGCITCHNGKNIGGNSFQKIGIVIPYDNCYLDRYDVTKNQFDKCVYKVPTLRNIELTAPYFHDGSAKTLKEAIKKMSYHNLGFELDKKDIYFIEQFLKTLKGQLPYEKK